MLSPPPGRAAPVAGSRLIGSLAAVGGVALLLSPHFGYIRFSGYTTSLDDTKWFDFATFAVFGLAAYAAFCLLRTRSPAIGLALLVGLLPVTVAQALGHLYRLVVDHSALGPGPGWVLGFAGLTLLATAGVLAGAQWHHHIALPRGRPPAAAQARSIGAIAAALVVGAVSSFGWARTYGIDGDALFGVARPVQTLIFRLVIVSALVWLVGPRTKLTGWARLGGFAGATGLLVALFVSNDQVWNTSKAPLLFAFAALAVGGAVVPVLATVVVPVRQGLVLLAAWIAASAAWLVPVMGEGREAGGIAIALVAAMGLAAFLASLDRAAQRTGAGRAPLNRAG